MIAFALMILPAEWVLCWILAAGIHEVSHYIALLLCKVEVYEIRVGPFGAQIQTACMTLRNEAGCAAAGPLGGALLIVLYGVLPELAICAAIQSVYNLLPIPTMDGGRILNALLIYRLGEKRGKDAARWIAAITVVCFPVLGLYLWLVMRKGTVLFVAMSLLAIKSARKIT